jgi:hypothetical protein
VVELEMAPEDVRQLLQCRRDAAARSVHVFFSLWLFSLPATCNFRVTSL